MGSVMTGLSVPDSEHDRAVPVRSGRCERDREGVHRGGAARGDVASRKAGAVEQQDHGIRPREAEPVQEAVQVRGSVHDRAEIGLRGPRGERLLLECERGRQRDRQVGKRFSLRRSQRLRHFRLNRQRFGK